MQGESVIDLHLWQVGCWMHNCARVLLIIPKEHGFLTIMVIPVPLPSLNWFANLMKLRMLIGELGKYKTFLMRWVWSWPENIFPAPLNIPNSCCLIFWASYCSNRMRLQWLNFTNKYVFVIAYMNICAIITNHWQCIAIEVDSGALWCHIIDV